MYLPVPSEGGWIACLCQSVFAIFYFIIGVLLPFLSLYYSRSGPALCILSHRHHYYEQRRCFKNGRSFIWLYVRMSHVLGPLFAILGLVLPCYFVYEMLHEQANQMIDAEIHRSVEFILCTGTGLFGMLIFGE